MQDTKEQSNAIDPEGVSELYRIACRDPDPKVRAEARIVIEKSASKHGVAIGEFFRMHNLSLLDYFSSEAGFRP